MKVDTAVNNLLTKNLIHEIAKTLALPPTQPRRIIASLTGKAVHRFLESHMSPRLSHVASDSLRQI